MSVSHPRLDHFPRQVLQRSPTPLERLDHLSDDLGIDLWIKRDDLTSISFGGNKVRQLEFYLGEACAKGADTILITGAVQSNFVRTAAAAANKLGMQAVLQLEDRVSEMPPSYHSSGNVMLGKLLDAKYSSYPFGEDEKGADGQLHKMADELSAKGKVPYVIHLGADHPPLGALGYVCGGLELAGQAADIDRIIVPSGSAATHSGMLGGLKLTKHAASVHGICVRRDANAQLARLIHICTALDKLVGSPIGIEEQNLKVWDGALAPGYGKFGKKVANGLKLMARREGIFLDPVYSGKTFAGLLDLIENGTIQKGEKVVFLHTGGQSALFGYQELFEQYFW